MRFPFWNLEYLDPSYIDGLRPLRAILDNEANPLALIQVAEALADNVGIMDENVLVPPVR